MAPERIQGLSYTITSDVWSLGVTLLEVAQHRFPFGQTEDGGGHARAGLIDLLTYIVRQPIPELKDEPDLGIKWSDNFKYFIACWYVFLGFERTHNPLVFSPFSLPAWRWG
jgi:mitogen-activated protein kinase kinase